MLFDIPFLADWNKIGDYRQCQTDCNTRCKNKTHVDQDYKVGNKVLVHKDGTLRKTESKYDGDPWTITSVHTNGTIRVQRGTKSERLNIEELHHTLVKCKDNYFPTLHKHLRFSHK